MRSRIPWIVMAGALLAAPAWAQERQASDKRMINVDGEAEVKVAPDQITLTLGIETSDKDLAKAKALNDERSRSILAALTSAGVEAKHIQTDYLDIEPRYEWSSRQENFIGYFVRKSFVVSVKTVSRFEDILTAALNAGANYVLGVQFLTSALRTHRDSARALAIGAAREKAVAMAGALGQSVGEPHTISELNSRWYYGYGRSWWGSRPGSQMQNVVQNAGGDGNVGDSAISPGQISVYASVRVSFELR